ncbi:MAG: DSD1 family PLP-dependent enzyme [Sphingosinicella sp.]|nr:DSD1 family PLP-dependent enzyme [Sphingosinicella sp.]
MLNHDLIGAREEDLPTPALIVDLDILEANLERLAARFAGTGLRFRPHAKAHKCVEIARRQIALGAVGICCQTVAEVEAFAAGGISDILLTNEITDPAKITRLAAIPEGVRIGICVDSVLHLQLIADAIWTRPIDLYIEVDVGGGRCGTADPQAALALAREAERLGLTLAGLQAYNGKAQHLRDPAERQRVVETTAATTRNYVQTLSDAGFPPVVVSGAGTGTVDLDLQLGALNEFQCGTYALMDVDYLAIDPSGDADRYAPALTVLASVISAAPGRAVIDAGLKSFALDSGMPVPRDLPGVTYGNASDEHGILRNVDSQPLPAIGTHVHLIPDHCDPTIALYERIHAVRDGLVEEVWPIVARGKW